MIYTKELPYTFSEVEHALSYDILSHIFGVDAESIKGTVQYTNLAEMTGIIYAYDTPIRDIWSECFDNADIIVPSKIERGQLLDDKTYVTKYTKDYIIDLILPDTLSKYTYQELLGKKYIMVEWKSGDYVFGKVINGYYVLEKM